MKPLVFSLPLVVFVVLGLLFGALLLQKDKPDLISLSMPKFSLARFEGEGKFTQDDLKKSGQKIMLVNIFASWCVPCRAEHESLLALAQKHRLPVYGIAYKDSRENLAAYLDKLGNPFTIIGLDEKGRSFFDWGASGVPESFLIGSDGMIRYHHKGVLTPEQIDSILLPLIQEISTP